MRRGVLLVVVMAVAAAMASEPALARSARKKKGARPPCTGCAGGTASTPSQAQADAPAQPLHVASAPKGEAVHVCPAGGETYPSAVTYCPEHGVELKVKD